MGTRVGDIYEWLTFKEVSDIAENLSYGLKALEMVPEVTHDGKTWKFLGIQSKNRKEWVLLHLANMH